LQIYSGFNEGVTCKDPSTASLIYSDRVCDPASQKVRVCNKSTCTPVNGSYSYLPRTREVGWIGATTIATYKTQMSASYYPYTASTNYAPNTLVRSGA